jgi:hypothetical protein
MHRVYNSAFMHMLRDEENAEYRSVLREVLAFDPGVLQRFVNFMTTPDEAPAIEQFGSGDRYAGVATLMATLPGLPMFGHGQVEGFREKYGMEYRRAFQDEEPDAGLVERHARQIAPLLRARDRFAGVADFELFDAQAHDGSVNEDVLAYSNGVGEGRSLVVYHNRLASASVRIRASVPRAVAAVSGSVPAGAGVRRNLADVLGLHAEAGWSLVLRDARSGLEERQPTREIHEHGLRLNLGPYDCRVYLDVREEPDGPGGEPAVRLTDVQTED